MADPELPPATSPDLPTAPEPPSVLIFCTDLFFATKITGTAKLLSRPFGVAHTIAKLRQLLEEAAPHPLLIVDLGATGVDPLEVIRVAKTHPVPPQIVAFLSHTQVELAAAAREAGADRVMARSAFALQLPNLITEQAGAS